MIDFPFYKPTELELDLKARWAPSQEQITQAHALLATQLAVGPGTPHSRGVYTAHLLVGKHYGFWTKDVVLVYLDGVFTSREACLKYVDDEARRHHEEHPLDPVVGGWAWHSRVGHWAVWEDILACYPKED